MEMSFNNVRHLATTTKSMPKSRPRMAYNNRGLVQEVAYEDDVIELLTSSSSDEDDVIELVSSDSEDDGICIMTDNFLVRDLGWKMTLKCHAITGEYDYYYHSPKTGKIFPSVKKAMNFNHIVEEFHSLEDDALYISRNTN